MAMASCVVVDAEHDVCDCGDDIDRINNADGETAVADGRAHWSEEVSFHAGCLFCFHP
jgi:hypothetical protein